MYFCEIAKAVGIGTFPQEMETYYRPEDTRLRRALKQIYLDGGYIYAYSGVIF